MKRCFKFYKELLTIILVQKLNIMHNFMPKQDPIYPKKTKLFLMRQANLIHLMGSLFTKQQMKLQIFMKKIICCHLQLHFLAVLVIQIKKVVKDNQTDLKREENISKLRKIKESKKQQMMVQFGKWEIFPQILQDDVLSRALNKLMGILCMQREKQLMETRAMHGDCL